MYESYLKVSAVFLTSMLLGYMRSSKAGQRTQFIERNHLISEANIKVFKLIDCLSFPYLKSASLKYRNMLAARWWHNWCTNVNCMLKTRPSNLYVDNHKYAAL